MKEVVPTGYTKIMGTSWVLGRDWIDRSIRTRRVFDDELPTLFGIENSFVPFFLPFNGSIGELAFYDLVEFDRAVVNSELTGISDPLARFDRLHDGLILVTLYAFTGNVQVGVGEGPGGGGGPGRP